MRFALEQVRCDTRPWRKRTNSLQRSEERRKLPMTIARAMGGLNCQPPGRSPGAAKTVTLISGRHLEPKYGGNRHGLQRLFGQVLVSRKSSVKLCSAGIADY